MTDVATNLSTINSSLSDIKTAIVNKGVTPSGNITTYATAIGSISGGASPTGLKVNVTYQNGASWGDVEYIRISVNPNNPPVFELQGEAGAYLPITLGYFSANDTVYYEAVVGRDASISPDDGSITLQGDYAELNFVVSLD
jgi:hypothetical protein